MSNERRILQLLIAYHGRHATYPTIAHIAATLDQKPDDVTKIVMASRRFDYTVPVRGEKGWRDDACNWTVEPVDVGDAYRELGRANN